MVDSVGIKYSNYYRPHFKGEVEKVNNTERSFENDKDATEKYLTSKNIMLGLSAIGLATLGIIGHRNGWFSRAVKNASDGVAGSSKNPKAQPTGIEPEILHGSREPISKKTFYQEDGKTIESILDFDPNTGNKCKYTSYQKDGKTIKAITDYDPNTGNRIKYTSYQEDGKTIKAITDYDPNTGNRIKYTSYQEDGKTIKEITDYDPKTGKEIK